MTYKQILTENILPFWLGDAIDRVNGGIYTSLDRFQNISRCSHTHQISRLILWQIRNSFFYYMIHIFVGFSHRKTANGITIQIHL